MAQVDATNLMDLAHRIREMREITGLSVSEMAEKTEVSVDQYLTYEEGYTDIPFTFIHKCALTFHVGMSDLLEGQSARLSTFTVTRKGHLQDPITEDGIQIMNMAPMFRRKIAEPYWVHYEYLAEQQNKPIHLTTHSGQEFDYVLSGKLKVQVNIANARILDGNGQGKENFGGSICVMGQCAKEFSIVDTEIIGGLELMMPAQPMVIRLF